MAREVLPRSTVRWLLPPRARIVSLSVVPLALVGGPTPCHAETPEAPGLYVQSSSLPLRASPSTSSAQIARLSIGESCTALSEPKDGFIGVECGGKRGFVLSDLLSSQPPSMDAIEAKLFAATDPTTAFNLALQRLALAPDDEVARSEVRARFFEAELASLDSDTTRSSRRRTMACEADRSDEECLRRAGLHGATRIETRGDRFVALFIRARVEVEVGRFDRRGAELSKVALRAQTYESTLLLSALDAPQGHRRALAPPPIGRDAFRARQRRERRKVFALQPAAAHDPGAPSALEPVVPRA